MYQLKSSKNRIHSNTNKTKKMFIEISYNKKNYDEKKIRNIMSDFFFQKVIPQFKKYLHT